MCIIHGEKRSRDEVDEVGGEHAAGAAAPMGSAAGGAGARQRRERGGKKKGGIQRAERLERAAKRGR